MSGCPRLLLSIWPTSTSAAAVCADSSARRSARLRWMTAPSWTAMPASACTRSASSSRALRTKNSSTAMTPSSASTGMPTPAKIPARAAASARGRLGSSRISCIQVGSRVVQTRPGSPSSGAKVKPWLSA
jgi:hypothetical protein